ncbi:MAG TPA: biotin--[acetyl-CoA-carboxylase] ligase [Gaiellaceae bacterium]|nr:biotin--[acetyl-CoA-carboxylase] ligase [Gaiellaceae bacterium]
MRIGHPRTHVPECDSTQLLLPPDAPEGAVATTDHQTAGRGRLGRRWEEAPGTAVLVSVLLRPPAERRAAEVSLVAAVAAAAAVTDVTGVEAGIKWPNDVILDRRKVAGMLAEARTGAVVLGIGVNVNQTDAQLPPHTKVRAGSLRSVTGREFDREEVLSALLDRLEDAYRAWLVEGLAAVHAELAARDVLRGRALVAGGRSGRGGGIDAAGRLLVDTGDTVLAVESGEVLVEL